MNKVAPNAWEPPEHLSLTERDFLVDRAETINGIIAKSYLEVGQVLLQVKRKFKRDPDLDGWFCRWIEETLPIGRVKCQTLAIIAEKVEEDRSLKDLTENVGYTALYQALLLPGSAREDMLEMLKAGETITQRDIREVGKQPEFILEAAQETVDELQMRLLDIEIELTTSSSEREKYDLKNRRSDTKQRLKRSLGKLREAEQQVDELEKIRSTQEVILNTLQKQLKQKDVLIENMSLDPEQKRKRALAQTVVDATKGLDLLLSSIDRYGTDKPELGIEAISTIERKMDEVKSKLLEHYADLPKTGGSS